MLCEHYHYTPEQVGQMTLYQIKLLSLGSEKVAEIGRARAAKLQDSETQARRQYLIDWYARRGVNAR